MLLTEHWQAMLFRLLPPSLPENQASLPKMLHAEKRILADAFGTTQFTGMFGSSETGVWGLQPDWLPIGTYVCEPVMIMCDTKSARL